MIHAHVLEDFDEPALALLRANLADSVQLTSGSDIPADTNIFIGGRPTREQLAACPILRAIIVPWAGVPENTRELLRDFRK